MTYQSVLLDGNNVSYRVANIATTTTDWLQEQHLLAASSSSFISCRPKSNDERQGAGNERERPISSHIASRDGDDFNAIYHIVSHGGDYDNDYNRIDFIFIASRNGDSNNNGCGNNICYPPAPRLSTTCRVKATTNRTRYCVTHGNNSS
jgi:hypothetical protein